MKSLRHAPAGWAAVESAATDLLMGSDSEFRSTR